METNGTMQRPHYPLYIKGEDTGYRVYSGWHLQMGMEIPPDVDGNGEMHYGVGPHGTRPVVA
jgi:hypothetical protein